MENFFYKKVTLDDTELMEKIYRLRFEVYARECGFIKEEDYPNGIETDEYDHQACHFAALNSEGDVIGTLRVILPGQLPFPIEHHCPFLNFHKDAPPAHQYVEISRLVISKRLRRRKNDALYYEPQIEDKKMRDQNNQEFLRRAKPMAFGLYREMYNESKRLGVTHWYSLMEKSLWLLLRLHGFKFECIGEEVDVYGPVRPYLGNVGKIEEEVRTKYPKIYKYFTEYAEIEPITEFQS